MSLDTFEPFSLPHLLVVLFVAAIIAVVVTIGRKWRGTSRQRQLELSLGVAALGVWLIANGYYFLPGPYTLVQRLPLHVTDFLGLVAPAAMLWPNLRVLRAVLYYCGIGLGSLAFVTPDLGTGPAGIGFWLFMGGHLVIVGFAIYDLVVRAYRPNWRDFWSAVALGLAYVAFIVPVNLLLDANYAYLGQRLPSRPTPIDYFPPWPWRIFVMIALTMAGMALMTLPWTRARKARRYAQPQATSTHP